MAQSMPELQKSQRRERSELSDSVVFTTTRGAGPEVPPWYYFHKYKDGKLV